MKIFVLQHAYAPSSGLEEVKLIGVYSLREKAESAIERLRAQPGFINTPHGFQIDEYQLDADHWCEGFVSV